MNPMNRRHQVRVKPWMVLVGGFSLGEVDGSLRATTTGQGHENHVNLVPNSCGYAFVRKKRPV